MTARTLGCLVELSEAVLLNRPIFPGAGPAEVPLTGTGNLSVAVRGAA